MCVHVPFFNWLFNLCPFVEYKIFSNLEFWFPFFYMLMRPRAVYFVICTLAVCISFSVIYKSFILKRFVFVLLICGSPPLRELSYLWSSKYYPFFFLLKCVSHVSLSSCWLKIFLVGSESTFIFSLWMSVVLAAFKNKPYFPYRSAMPPLS